MTDEQPRVLDSILKIWGPITLLIGAIAMGAQATVRLSYAEDRIVSLEAEINEMKKEAKKDLDGVRNVLGKIQINQSAICEATKARCKY